MYTRACIYGSFTSFSLISNSLLLSEWYKFYRKKLYNCQCKAIWCITMSCMYMYIPLFEVQTSLPLGLTPPLTCSKNHASKPVIANHDILIQLSYLPSSDCQCLTAFSPIYDLHSPFPKHNIVISLPTITTSIHNNQEDLRGHAFLQRLCHSEDVTKIFYDKSSGGGQKNSPQP